VCLCVYVCARSHTQAHTRTHKSILLSNVSVERATKKKEGKGKGDGKTGGTGRKRGKETDPLQTKNEFNISIPFKIYIITLANSVNQFISKFIICTKIEPELVSSRAVPTCVLAYM
jgi:hypothetical protein